MKKTDCIRLGLIELRYDIKGTALALCVQVSIFFLIIVLHMLNLELMDSFDSYLKTTGLNFYEVDLGGFCRDDKAELQKDGIYDIRFEKRDSRDGKEIFFDANGKISSISDYKRLVRKWEKKGKVIYAEMLEELCQAMFVGKCILFTLALAVYILFLGTISNLYAMKLDLRKDYIKILYSLGMKLKNIRKVFFMQFRICSLVAALFSLLGIKQSFLYINNILSSEFSGMYIRTDMLIVLEVILLLGNDIIMKFMFFNIWRRERQEAEK
jgi:hypothetical protein